MAESLVGGNLNANGNLVKMNEEIQYNADIIGVGIKFFYLACLLVN